MRIAIDVPLSQKTDREFVIETNADVFHCSIQARFIGKRFFRQHCYEVHKTQNVKRKSVGSVPTWFEFDQFLDLGAARRRS